MKCSPFKREAQQLQAESQDLSMPIKDYEGLSYKEMVETILVFLGQDPIALKENNAKILRRKITDFLKTWDMKRYDSWLLPLRPKDFFERLNDLWREWQVDGLLEPGFVFPQNQTQQDESWKDARYKVIINRKRVH